MFLVLGQPRSGTTLVAQCLNAHPDLVVPDETDLVVPLAFLVDRIEDPDLGRDLAATLITRGRRFAASIGEYLEVDRAAAVVRSAPWSLNGILTELYAAVADAGGGRLGGDKSPNDLKFLRILLTAHAFGENLPVVHVVRDIRDVMASFQDLGWAQGLPEGMVRMWVANNLMVEGNVTRQGSPYVRIRHEDVVADPVGAFSRVCSTLGVDWDPGMIDDERRYRQFRGHEGMAQHAQTFQPISADRVGRHREALDPTIIARIEELAAEGLEAFGYL